MAYSKEIKEEVKKRLENGEKAKQISEQTGVSIPTIYHWKREFNQQNEELKDKSKKESINNAQDKVVPKDKQEQQGNNQTMEEQENNTYSRFQNGQKSFKERIRVEQDKCSEKEIKDKTKSKVNHYQEVWNYLIEKKHDIYIKLQSKDYRVQKEGIIQWDLMDGLLEKVSKNKDDKDCMNQLYERILRLKEKENGMNR